MSLNILFLSRWFPYPPSNGSKLRIYNLLRGVGQYHHVTLLTFLDQPKQDIAADVVKLQTLCEEVQVIPLKSFNPNSWRARFGFLSIKPRSVIDTYSLQMKQTIEQLLSTKNFDVVIASQVDMAIYSDSFSRLPAIFEEVEVGVLFERFSQAHSMKQQLRFGLTWAKHRRYLASLLKNFLVCTVVSEKERQLLLNVVNSSIPVEVVPNCVDLTSYESFSQVPQPNTLIFTGSFSYEPNYEAMVWFLREVYPLIQVEVPEVKLIITGNHCNRSLPPAHNVELTGFVDDVQPLIKSAWASVVPLHTGGGTRLKILEAMALHTPVIATSKGAEGLDVRENEHLLITDTPDEFAQATIRLLKDQNLRQFLTHNAYQLVSRQYDWNIVNPLFLELVERTAHASASIFSRQ